MRKMIPRTTNLTDNELNINPLKVSDAGDLAAAVHESMNEIMPWMGWCTPEYDEIAAREWLENLYPRWEKGDQYAFAIRDEQNHKFLGVVGLNHINNIQLLGNLGYWVRTSETKRGIATRAAQLLAKFGIEKLSLLRVEIVVAVGNEPSLRVAAKTGATCEGVLRNRLIVREAIFDAVMHSLTPQDFKISQSEKS